MEQMTEAEYAQLGRCIVGLAAAARFMELELVVFRTRANSKERRVCVSVRACNSVQKQELTVNGKLQAGAVAVLVAQAVQQATRKCPQLPAALDLLRELEAHD